MLGITRIKVEAEIEFGVETREVSDKEPLLSVGAFGRLMASLLLPRFLEEFTKNYGEDRNVKLS